MKTPPGIARFLFAGLALAAVAGILAGFFASRSKGFSERFELPLYDAVTQATWPWKTGHSDVCLVTVQDPTRWPLSDESLAQLLDELVEAEASVIVVDLIRDHAIEPGSARLERRVLENPGILMARGIPGDPDADFAPPPFTARLPDGQDSLTVGLAGFPVDDRTGRIRRGLISIEEGRWFSLPALAAFHHRIHQDPEGAAAHVQTLESLATLSGNSAGYAGLGTAGDQFLLKLGPDSDSCLPLVSITETHSMSPAARADFFGGKVVFIGTHDASIAQDEKHVVGNEKLRGVKLLALATAQLLREMESGEPPVRWTSVGINHALNVLLSLLAVVGCWRLPGRPVLRSLLLFPLLALLTLGAMAWLLTQGIWMPAGAPLAGTLVSTLGGFAVVLAAERRRSRALYGVLEKNLSPQIARAVWENNRGVLAGGEPDSGAFVGTALFADLAAYSETTARFTDEGRPEALFDWLNRYLGSLVSAVQQSGGFVQQFAGDGVFVIFGFPPGGDDDHAERAVRFATELAVTVGQLNQDLPPDDPRYLARVGIYTGEIMTGHLGGGKQQTFNFLGSTINKASRLESIRKTEGIDDQRPVRVLVSESTHRATEAQFAYLPFGDGPCELDKRLPPEPVWIVGEIPR